ncbi:uncharacterized protein LOC123538414 [Mercenaria mercenaria]|uniref:uncharacterized protein LOC123538414 n=1 Tax=Mercenaria mercenaria TaxID=6596 RepID=UPI00234FA31F|nr:uncharacterized protein LOC123538414 [Mercenaria mercenaria]
MDDIDGAMFSRVPLKESLEMLVDYSALSVKGFSQGYSNEDKYSKLENSNSTPQLNEKLLKSGYKCNEETIIKRESVSSFYSVPPSNKDTETRVKLKLQIPQLSSRASAPCSLNTECVNEHVDISTGQSNTDRLLTTPQRPLFNRVAETQNVSSEQLQVIDPTKSDSKNIVLPDLFGEMKAENNTREELRREIPHRAVLSSSGSIGRSNSFGDVDSSLDTDHLANELPPSSILKISVEMNKSDSESVPDLEKGLPKNRYKSIESIETPSRVSFVSYLNENDAENIVEATLFTLDIKTQNDQNGNVSTVGLSDKTWKNTGTDATDACGKQCTENTEHVVVDNKTDRFYESRPPVDPLENKSYKFCNTRTPLDPLENHIILKNNKQTKRRKPIVCRIITGLAVPILSLVVYIWDIGSDIRLAIAYKEQGDINLFWITTACIVIPVILMSIVDISWLWLDRPPSRVSHIVRYILGVFTLGRIVRSVTYMWHIIKSKTLSKKEEKLWHKKRATEEKRDCFMLDFINAFAESVPQLFVQLYLMYAFDLQLTKVRTLNLLSSWASIAWTYSAYYKCNREVLVGKQDIKITGFAIFFMSVLSALAARVISVVLFLIYFKTWIGIFVLSVHVIYMLLWIIFKEKPTLEGTTSSKFGKYMYCIFFAYVSLLCFLNLRNSKARFRMAAFYLLIYIENFTFAVLSFYKMYTSEVRNDKLLNLIALPVGFVLHVFLLVLYYQIFHPKTGRSR